ncbi:MAG TPA: hypothetical protein VIM69_08670 [Opitutaceae bacterium]
MIHLPALRLRSRVTWALATAIAIVVCVLLLWRADRRIATLVPSVYLVANGEPVQVRVGFRTHTVRTQYSVPVGKKIVLKEGAEIDALFADGHREHWKGPFQLVAPASAAGDATFINETLLQALKTPPPTEATTTIQGAPANQIRVMTPSGLTRFLNPVIDWKAKDGIRYDVAVIDLADPNAPPRTLLGMRPPVSVSSLQTPQGPKLVPDRIYGVVVRITGEQAIGGTSRFLTSADAALDELPTEPAPLLEEAFNALTVNPARVGDGWLALSRLPDDWKQTELAVRLRLLAASQLNLHKEYAEAQADVKALAHR